MEDLDSGVRPLFALAAVTLAVKICAEERVLGEMFGREYDAYRADKSAARWYGPDVRIYRAECDGRRALATRCHRSRVQGIAVPSRSVSDPVGR